jgi:hypothetical protein
MGGGWAVDGRWMDRQQRPARMIVRGIRLETGRIRLTITGNRLPCSVRDLAYSQPLRLNARNNPAQTSAMSSRTLG